jgi:predicted phage terminase large subunit-like protein
MTTDSVKPPYIPPAKPKRLFESVSLEDIPKILPLLSEAEQEQLLLELDKLEEMKTRKAARDKFMPFVRAMWPSFISGRHHAKMAEAFEKVANGEIKRLIINMPPRHTKSEFASYLLPAWFLGKNPGKKVIQTSHTAELAVGFGRKVRNLVDTDAFHDVFPDLVLQSDSKAAGRWNTSKGGDYFAIGVGGAVTGKGADCVYFACNILTRRGIVSIVDVRVGDDVYGYDHETQRCRWTPVRAVSTQRKPELVSLNGVLLTPEHRVFTPSGYVRAETARSVAVRAMRHMVHAGAEGVQSEPEPLRSAGDHEGLLFKSVRHASGYVHGVPSVWGLESADGAHLQGLLPERQERRADLCGLREGLRSPDVGAHEKRTEARRGGADVLLQSLLRAPSRYETEPGNTPNGGVQNVWGRDSGGETLLLDGVLWVAESENRRVHGEVVGVQARSEEAGQRHLRLLRERAPAGGGSPYRPQCVQQRDEQPADAVRPLPQPLSSSDVGAAARGYQAVLPGEGRWVVDLQTDTHNFFVAPPGELSEIAFKQQAILAHNCLIIDDPHSEQEAALAEVNPEIYDKTYEWYTSGPRQRLQPGGAIIIVATRWSKRDLVARVLEASAQRGGEDWTVIEFPAILPSGKPLWPEFWPLPELQALKDELPNSKWMAQYQQQPTSDTSAIIKREWWQKWPSDVPPDCDFILQTWDTAFEKTQRSDYSAVTTWGVFYKADDTGVEQANIILLDAFRERMEFPKLKQKAIDSYKEWQPDSVIIEKKASGAPLIYEMRAMGIPVQEFTPTRGNDKISRLNAVADIFASGRVWAPNTSWAEEVIEEVASFPSAQHDDYTDTVSMALSRFRKGGYITTDLDEPDDIRYFKSHRAQGYY